MFQTLRKWFSSRDEETKQKKVPAMILEYQKKDGTKRLVTCATILTLQLEGLLPKTPKEKSDEQHLLVWDFDKEQFRTLLKNKIITFSHTHINVESDYFENLKKMKKGVDK